MFHVVSGASKVAVVDLCGRLARAGVVLLDTEDQSDHLAQLGQVPMARKTFVESVHHLREERNERPSPRAAFPWRGSWPYEENQRRVVETGRDEQPRGVSVGLTGHADGRSDLAPRNFAGRSQHPAPARLRRTVSAARLWCASSCRARPSTRRPRPCPRRRRGRRRRNGCARPARRSPPGSRGRTRRS